MGQRTGVPTAQAVGRSPQRRIAETAWVILLMAVAAGAVLTDRFAHELALPAGVVFGLAGVSLVAYAGSRLGILPDVERLLHAWKDCHGPSKEPPAIGRPPT